MSEREKRKIELISRLIEIRKSQIESKKRDQKNKFNLKNMRQEKLEKIYFKFESFSERLEELQASIATNQIK